MSRILLGSKAHGDPTDSPECSELRQQLDAARRERDAARSQATSAERGRAEAERLLEKQRHELETAHRWLDAHLSRDAPPEAGAPPCGVTQWRGRIEDPNGDGSVIARMWKIADCAECLITLSAELLRGQVWRRGSAVDLWEWLPAGAWVVVDAEADELNLLRVRCDMLRSALKTTEAERDTARGEADRRRAECACIAAAIRTGLAPLRERICRAVLDAARLPAPLVADVVCDAVEIFRSEVESVFGEEAS